MKLLLFRVLLRRRARDEGFTLPMVIALGLVMILLGVTSIAKSSEENINAITQNSSSDALAIAEVGVTKYREFLNQNRILTVYNHNQWTSNSVAGIDGNNINVQSQTCNNVNQPPASWTGSASRPSDDAFSATDKSTSDNDNWWNVSEDIDGDGTAETIGQYRLVSYEYDIDGNTGDADDDGNIDDTDDNFSLTSDELNDLDGDGNSDAIGILTIQGRRVNQNNETISEAQISVEIPLRINQQDMDNLAPALWINSRDSDYLNNLSTNLSTLSIAGGNNIVLSTAPSNSGCSDPADIGGNIVVGDPRRIPVVRAIINTLTAAGATNRQTTLTEVGGENIVGRTLEKPFRELTQAEIDNSETFDAADHCQDINDCRYYYHLGGSPTTISRNTKTDGIAKATIYINSDLTINNVDVGSDISSSYFEIYVNGSRNVTVNTSAGNTVEIDAFIHAPGSTLTITGDGDVIFRGSVWVNEFINSTTGSVTIDPDDTDSSSTASDKSYEYYTTTFRRSPRPLTASPTNWVKEEVD